MINTCVLFNLGLYLNGEEADEYDDITDKITTIMKKLIKVYPAIKSVPQYRFIPTLQMLAKDPESKAGSLALKLIFLFYRRKEIVYEAKARVTSAVALVAKLSNKAKIIIFGERISQTDLLFLALDKAYPNRVARYHSEMGEVARKHAIDRDRDGEVRILRPSTRALISPLPMWALSSLPIRCRGRGSRGWDASYVAPLTRESPASSTSTWSIPLRTVPCLTMALKELMSSCSTTRQTLIALPITPMTLMLKRYWTSLPTGTNRIFLRPQNTSLTLVGYALTG